MRARTPPPDTQPAAAGAPRRRPSAASGVTLLELLVTLAVGALLAAVAVPAMRHTAAAADRHAPLSAFVTAVHYARSTAITRAVEAVVCKSRDGLDCERGAGSSWHAGTLVFANEDGDEPPRVDVGEAVLLVAGPLHGVQVDGNREAFVFRPFARRSTNGTLVVCDRRGAAHARALVISYTGRPRIADHHPDGRPLTCPDPT